MEARPTGILYVPADYGVPRAGLRAAWRRHVVANSCPRDAAYMKALFADRFPGGSIVEITDPEAEFDWPERSQTLVLLFPDAIGLDFGAIERRVAACCSRQQRVLILNGRRRLFRWEPYERRRLAWRRFLERSRAPELALLSLFALCTPLLVIVDLLRGRR